MPLLSVVVPTHNRSQYAISCIQSVLAFQEQKLELVVTDTSTDGRLEGLLQEPSCRFLADPRFKYAKLEGPSNLTKNHTDAVSKATGEYVIIIGDDDAITQAAIDAARWASDNGVAAVSHNMRAVYAWTDFRSTLARAGHAGRLYVPREAGGIRWRSTVDDLDAALQRALQATDGMPRCYHGVVRREVLDDVRNRTGAYFHGSSPDMSGAVSLACVIDEYVETDLPLSIAGVSGNSNSGRSALNKHKGELSSETQTKSFEQQGWTDGVPKFFAVETVWSHAGLATLAKIAPERAVSFNFSRLIALCAVRHPEFDAEINRAASEASGILRHSLNKIIFLEKLRIRSERIAYLAKRVLIPTTANGRKYFAKLQTVADASRIYENYALNKGFYFSAVAESLSTHP